MTPPSLIVAATAGGRPGHSRGLRASSAKAIKDERTRMKNMMDDVAWVRRVNSRWIVRQGMRESASAYLDYLAETDSARLIRSCRRARRLTARPGSDEDPKPWFYAGLFSLASDEEVTRFLTEHPFTLAALPAHAAALPGFLGPDSVAKTTWEKILRIRQSVTDLAKGENGI